MHGFFKIFLFPLRPTSESFKAFMYFFLDNFMDFSETPPGPKAWIFKDFIYF